MNINDNIIEKAFKRSGGKCECRSWTHNHNVVRCGQDLIWERHGKEGKGRWEARCINPKVPESASSYEILCADCYKRILFGM